MPKLMGVQAEGSAACYNEWKTGTETITPVDAHTISDSISVGLPRDGIRAVRAVRETNGAYLTVSDEEVLEAMRKLARGGSLRRTRRRYRLRRLSQSYSRKPCGPR